MLLASLATGLSERVAENPDIPPATQDTIIAKAEEGIDIVPVADVEQAALEGGLPSSEADALATDYGDAQLEALRLALGGVAAAALLSLWFTRRLPTASAAQPDVDPAEPATTPA